MRIRNLLGVLMVFFSGFVTALHVEAIRDNDPYGKPSSLAFACFLGVVFAVMALDRN